MIRNQTGYFVSSSDEKGCDEVNYVSSEASITLQHAEEEVSCSSSSCFDSEEDRNDNNDFCVDSDNALGVIEPSSVFGMSMGSQKGISADTTDTGTVKKKRGMDRKLMRRRNNASALDSEPPLHIGLPVGSADLPNYYNSLEIFPALGILRDNAHIMLAEALKVPKWTPWPEDLFDVRYGNAHEWTVFPFLHTFPAQDESKITWVESTCTHCPQTAQLLRGIPNIRTALFSRLGPHTDLSAHTGWADLANHVLRCHVSLSIPRGDACGLNVCREVRLHQQGGVIVFDDSKLHKAFNRTDEPRYVLILDILRPDGVPEGIAEGGHTQQLDNFIDYFK